MKWNKNENIFLQKLNDESTEKNRNKNSIYK